MMGSRGAAEEADAVTQAMQAAAKTGMKRATDFVEPVGSADADVKIVTPGGCGIREEAVKNA
jgi:hypothetical protein